MLMKTAAIDSPTKKKLLDAAQELMLVRGFTATSVDDVCSAAGVTKGSFFHYFEGTEQLGREVAERFFAAKRQLFQSAPFNQKQDPLERILGHIDFLIEMARAPEGSKGCLLGTFVQELSQTHPTIREVCAACFAGQTEWLGQGFRE